MTNSRGPLFIAIILLLLPLMYVVSYLALVVPGQTPASWVSPLGPPKIKYMISPTDTSILWDNYRCGDRYGKVVFWPVEQIDRRLRPEKWNPTPVELHLPSYAGFQPSKETEEIDE